ncbi:hypothetical protein Bca4012_097142 [Brassica carinata]|uniref:Small ribosomal subunit protein bS18c n=1 Tax=Brassica napus TaxID=3708 RepID=A0A816V303_BRANA|nr:unnamed protein product [Brassica napus]
MKLAHSAIRSLSDVASFQTCRPFVSRSLSTNANQGITPPISPPHILSHFRVTQTHRFPNRNQADPIQNRSSDDWMFGGKDEKANSFFQHLGKAEKDKRDYTGFSRSQGNGSRFDPSSDGVDGKLKEAALIYNVDDDEGVKDGYSFRPDVNSWGVNQFPRDMNFRRQMQRPRQNNKAEITTEEVLKKADFRNVRFLAQFITEAGILVKRKQTGISAKAQRKIAREIKTARAFGLMPFTTMGTKAFTFGKTMENRDQDFEYEVVDDDDEYDDNTPE